ncbi:MAG TPA: hypothetical protein VH139_02465 [Acidobacteriaceae bacterium]|nr:hypothetical protein [Acidobacteriaceae bacterium]
MDNATVAWISGGSAIGGGLVAGLLSGAYEHVRHWSSRPKLCLDYGEKEEASIVSVVTGTNEGNLNHLYVRVRLRNTGQRIAKHCVVYLASIEEVHESGNKATAFSDAMPLSWPLNDYKPRDIPNGADFYLDLVKISKHVESWALGVQQLYASQLPMLKFKGTYRFHLVATADNAESVKCTVDVKYAQDWNTLRAFPVCS